MAFRVVIIGGTGQVGAAVVRALIATAVCVEVVMINRRQAAPVADTRVREIVLDTASSGFEAEITRIAGELVAKGEPVYGASCVGVGAGSMKWTEDEL